ncbi:MAG: thiolase family protein [Actinobacteria bacterium]|nr:thiolase family protein [Actinomycetota bacterium]
MTSAVIVDAVRTAVASRNGKLRDWHPVDLAAEILRDLLERNRLDPVLVEDVILGCLTQIGEQGMNVARNAVLAAGFPDSVPGTTVDRQCGSSQQAIHFAAQGALAGAYDVVVAGGVESMTRVSVGSTIVSGPGKPFGPRMTQRYQPAGGLVPQGPAAELVAARYGLSRDVLDEYSLESHLRAARSAQERRFDGQIVPVTVEGRRGKQQFRADEGIRGHATLAQLTDLKPTFQPDGVITAGNAAPMGDGAAAVLVMSESRAAALEVPVRARFVAFAVAGVDPLLMLTGPIPATSRVLERAGLTLDDIDRFEVHESFAAVVLAWAQEHDVDLDRVNVNGGAIALGHPVGASGARMLATLLAELERAGGRYGLQVMCEGGGMANATIIERLG